jgi:hypothetical protein
VFLSALFEVFILGYLLMNTQKVSAVTICITVTKIKTDAWGGGVT